MKVTNAEGCWTTEAGMPCRPQARENELVGVASVEHLVEHATSGPTSGPTGNRSYPLAEQLHESTGRVEN
ncbi:hypothetical protein GCM10009744_30730 [Kribbella alba]|uniref:Uncharacterized protein n=1 Tax=Kribbella alba TaxID=190197 RepID=A0ABN2FBJ7_9ACTN